MAHPPTMSVFFLGTSSGGGPSESRNCSSLIVDALGNGDLWMVDCAEGTLRQFSMQPASGEQRYKAGRVRRIFVTHMHADHIMGLITMLRYVLRPPWFDHSRDGEKPPTGPTLEIYGPAGLRTFVRNCLVSTCTRTADTYVVHELLSESDPVTSCDPDVLHGSEAAGLDIRPSEDGFWKEILTVDSRNNSVVVDAGPIIHRDPCIGFILRETTAPFRKLVLLGDTQDPSALLPLIHSLPGPSPSLLVHEATDAYIPPHVDFKANRTVETVMEKCTERGHSTPGMAGQFAKDIGAERLVLNHIGSRFPAPTGTSSKGAHIRSKILKEIADQATAAWSRGRQAVVATDFLRIDIPAVVMPPADVLEGNLNTTETDLAMIVPQSEAHVHGDAPRGRGGYRGGGRRGHPQPAQSNSATGPPYPQYQSRRERGGGHGHHDHPRGRGGRGGRHRGRGRHDDHMDTFI